MTKTITIDVEITSDVANVVENMDVEALEVKFKHDTQPLTLGVGSVKSITDYFPKDRK